MKISFMQSDISSIKFDKCSDPNSFFVAVGADILQFDIRTNMMNAVKQKKFPFLDEINDMILLPNIIVVACDSGDLAFLDKSSLTLIDSSQCSTAYFKCLKVNSTPERSIIIAGGFECPISLVEFNHNSNIVQGVSTVPQLAGSFINPKHLHSITNLISGSYNNLILGAGNGDVDLYSYDCNDDPCQGPLKYYNNIASSFEQNPISALSSHSGHQNDFTFVSGDTGGVMKKFRLTPDDCCAFNVESVIDFNLTDGITDILLCNSEMAFVADFECVSLINISS